MEILQIVGFGLTAAVLIALIRSQAPQIALLLSLFAGAALFMLIVQRVGTVIGAMEHLAGAANIDWMFVQTILKSSASHTSPSLAPKSCGTPGSRHWRGKSSWPAR